jgi:TetR/AcrR family transcriptional regulator, transcriptional repressor of bet genes
MRAKSQEASPMMAQTHAPDLRKMMDQSQTSTAERRPSAERRRDIAEAALRCLMRVGYAELTARKVAAEAGISLGHITYHFENMEEVLAEACRLATEKLVETAEAKIAMPGATPAERLEAFLKAGFTDDFLTAGYLRSRIDLWSASLSYPAIAATERALHARYRAQVETLLNQVSDPWKTDRIPMVSDLIMATLDGLWLDWARRADKDAIKNGLEALTIC